MFFPLKMSNLTRRQIDAIDLKSRSHSRFIIFSISRIRTDASPILGGVRDLSKSLPQIPPNFPAFPSSSSILSNWLYFAFISLLADAPVLIIPAPKATEISAIVVSSVSADLWLKTTVAGT